MTRDEIIKMAVAARLLEIVDDAYLERCDWEPYVVRFFRAAYEAGAAAEREALTARILRCRYPVCNTIKPSGHDWDIPRLDEVIEAIRAREPK
jgi:hypothetical protein